MNLPISEIVKIVSEALGVIAKLFRTTRTGPILSMTVEILMAIAAVLDQYNSPLTSKEKREGVRFIAKFFKYAPEALLHQLADMKTQARFDLITPEELDASIGLAIATYVSGKKAQATARPPAKLTPPPSA